MPQTNEVFTVFVYNRIEDMVYKGEIAGYQHFFPFPTMFSEVFFLGIVKILDCVVKA